MVGRDDRKGKNKIGVDFIDIDYTEIWGKRENVSSVVRKMWK